MIQSFLSPKISFNRSTTLLWNIVDVYRPIHQSNKDYRGSGDNREKQNILAFDKLQQITQTIDPLKMIVKLYWSPSK